MNKHGEYDSCHGSDDSRSTPDPLCNHGPQPRRVLPYWVVGGLARKFASEILVGAPNFASKNISDKYPKFCSLNFKYGPKIGIFFPTFASCGNRTSQVFPLIWRTWPDLAPNFASNLDVRSKPPPDLLMWKYRLGPSRIPENALCFRSTS